MRRRRQLEFFGFFFPHSDPPEWDLALFFFFFLGSGMCPSETRLLTSSQKCEKIRNEFWVSPVGRICTFVANEKPFAVCFPVLWNKALMVINWFLVHCGNYYSSWEKWKRLPSMFCINSITFIWTQSRMCDVVPQGLLICKNTNVSSCYWGNFCWPPYSHLLPSGQWTQRPGSFMFTEVAQCWNSKDRRLECK